MEREQLVNTLNELLEQVDEARWKLRGFDNIKKTEELKKLVGGYFKRETGDGEIFPVNYNHIFIYDIKQDDGCAIGMEASYSIEENWFSISCHSVFHPLDNDWIETTKEEFFHHYEIVQQKINKTLNN